MNRKDVIDSRVTTGQTQILRYMDGEHLTRKECMLAKCFECCNGYIDGIKDCGITGCPLYAYMPYRKK